MADTKTISIARDFSRFPAGRFTTDGPWSGEGFRETILHPALLANSRVIVQLDGTLGYGSSFLEEAFGGLVRVHGISPGDLHEKLTLESRDSSLPLEIWSYVDKATAKDGKP